MKKCCECGKKYDENLEKCPSCELSNYNKSDDGKKKMIIIIVIAIAVIGIIALLIDLNSNKSGGGNNGGSGNPGGSYVAPKNDYDNDFNKEDNNGLEDLEVTKTIYAVKSVPEATKDLSLTVNLCFGDNKLNIHW